MKPDGLGGTDKQQSGLRDERHGAYDAVVPEAEAKAEQNVDSTPEGLRRARKGPMSPTRGRKGEE